MPPGINDHTQRICVSTPFCNCVGHLNPWDECCCMAGPERETCVACGSQLVLINLETGERVQEVAGA